MWWVRLGVAQRPHRPCRCRGLAASLVGLPGSGLRRHWCVCVPGLLLPLSLFVLPTLTNLVQP